MRKAVTARRAHLEPAIATMAQPRIDLSPLVKFTICDDLVTLCATPRDPVIEGFMLKCRDSPYLAERKKGPWFKWTRDPMVIDAVRRYAQRRHENRSDHYSDFPFGV